jgi:hypothetical protein
MRERRRLERFELHLPAEIVALLPGQVEEPTTLFTRDVSAAGAFFPTPHSFPTGTPVQVALELATGKLNQRTGARAQVRVHGIVARVCPCGMAVTFNEDYRMTCVKGNVGDRSTPARRTP